MHNKHYCWRSRMGIALLGLVVAYQPLMATEADIPFANESSLTSSHLVEAVLARNPDIPTMEATSGRRQRRVLSRPTPLMIPCFPTASPLNQRVRKGWTLARNSPSLNACPGRVNATCVAMSPVLSLMLPLLVSNKHG